MPEKRITVWAQRFKDHSPLVLQWLDPTTGKRKSKSAGTADEKEAEARRADLEYELNNGRYQEVSKMGWERFRELFEDEYVAPLREDTRTVYANVFSLFEKVCDPKQLLSINERTVSAFAAGLRKLPGRSVENMMPSTIKARLQFLHTALKWAADQKLMRHSSIQTTMDYYTNVDDAVEEAVLGPKRNGLSNKPAPSGQEATEELDLS